LIAVADINALWRKKPFEALAAIEPVLGLAPRDIRQAWRAESPKIVPSRALRFVDCPVTLPPGWATRFTGWTSRQLWRRAQAMAASQGSALKVLVVTSPHYLDLIHRAGTSVPTFYYCSDDYSQYQGWGGRAMVEMEAQLVRAVAHSFFVSEILEKRAIENYGVDRGRVSISPNATDESFLEPASQECIQGLLDQFPRLRRPLVGVVGGINDRLDFDVIAACAARPEVGSLAMIGPVDAGFASEGLDRLRGMTKCVFVGRQPHDSLPAWMQALDVALIPYRDTPLNRACSPMRLFDHMAAGRAIVSTSFCAQVHQYAEVVQIALDRNAVADLVTQACIRTVGRQRLPAMMEKARANTWAARAATLFETMFGEGS
jgi:glycosyltransferase involved in cell wall biosynthesis